MLILSRRTSESIIIGDEVTITVLSVKGKQVRIGIDAPPHIGVHREEIYERIKAEGEAGTKNSSSAGESDGADSTDVATGNQADSDADDNLGNV